MTDHAFHQSANDWARCKCGKLFADSRTKTAVDKLADHVLKHKTIVEV